jgi:hypothetical protein
MSQKNAKYERKTRTRDAQKQKRMTLSAPAGRAAAWRLSSPCTAASRAESSKMLGGESQIVSMIRVKCNGT